jgi:hypothetical protein
MSFVRLSDRLGGGRGGVWWLRGGVAVGAAESPRQPSKRCGKLREGVEYRTAQWHQLDPQITGEISCLLFAEARGCEIEDLCSSIQWETDTCTCMSCYRFVTTVNILFWTFLTVKHEPIIFQMRKAAQT